VFRRQGQRQGSMWTSFDEIPKSRGHVLYNLVQQMPVHAGFERFVENFCAPHYATTKGRPFGLHLREK